jgi:hypothetical protein
VRGERLGSWLGNGVVVACGRWWVAVGALAPLPYSVAARFLHLSVQAVFPAGAWAWEGVGTRMLCHCTCTARRWVQETAPMGRVQALRTKPHTPCCVVVAAPVFPPRFQVPIAETSAPAIRRASRRGSVTFQRSYDPQVQKLISRAGAMR